MMWGLYRAQDVPPTPDPVILQSFYAQFSNVSQVEAVLKDPASSALIASESILSLKELRIGGGKPGRGMAHISEMSVLYIHGCLAKLAMAIWGPDPLDSPDSLWNAACRIVALDTFRQLLACGTYNYMNVSLKHVNSISHMISAYNHYVHFNMAAKYKKELKNAGKIAQDNSRKSRQKRRERVSHGSLF